MTWRKRLIVALGVVVVLGACSAEEAPDAAGTDGSAQRAVLAQVEAVAPDDGSTEGITVVGTGRVSGVPDTLRVTVGVAVQRPEIQQALDAANSAATDLLAALADAGIDETDVATAEFSVQPRYEEQEPGENDPVVRGYEVRNLVDVTVRDLDRAGEVLGTAVEAAGDAARVQGVRFDLEDNGALLQSARERAFAEARAKAEQYAQLAGRELGSLISLREQAASAPQAEEFAARMADEAAVPLQPGSEEVSVSLVAVWALR
ncbi:MAG: SIMPL domain-containing protein [Egibacteraceae bacterium]